MVQVARIIGGAGTGKTTELLRLMNEVLKRGAADPYTIGFVSFTRAARREAAERAAGGFNLSAEDLEQHGWFKTLHAICYKQLGIGKELLTGKTESRKWIAEAIGEPVSGGATSDEDQDLFERSDASEADHALSIWDRARTTMQPVEPVWRSLYYNADLSVNAIPDLDTTLAFIEKYERHKTIDHRCDFTDLLGRFAGVKFNTTGHHERHPEGEVPDVPVWFLDEQQDTSALLDLVCRRLVENSRFAYLSLDPFQAIYGFAGSDSRHAMAWAIQDGKERVLPRSYRCPRKVLELGERCLKTCSDYWDRKIAARDEDGSVDELDFGESWEREINPNESWLLIARTNFQARRFAARLDEESIPWVPTRGNGGWKPCARLNAIRCLNDLQRGRIATAMEWRDVLKTLPVRAGQTELLKHGAKAEWSRKEQGWEELTDDVEKWGASSTLVESIKTGKWKAFINGAHQWVAGFERFGWEACLEPKIRIGTIHSVKGAEADNVGLLTTTSARVASALETQEGVNEEQRIAYVGVTRARKRLVVLQERANFRMEVPL